MVKKGPWTAEEDMLLTAYIEAHGVGHWRTLPKKAGLQRCGKGCRLRWMNYLRPNVKRGNISAEEEELIIRLHKLLGNRWSLIAGRVPGRTDNEIKNYWNTRLSKKLRMRKEADCSSAAAKATASLQPTENSSSSSTNRDPPNTVNRNPLQPHLLGNDSKKANTVDCLSNEQLLQVLNENPRIPSEQLTSEYQSQTPLFYHEELSFGGTDNDVNAWWTNPQTSCPPVSASAFVNEFQDEHSCLMIQQHSAAAMDAHAFYSSLFNYEPPVHMLPSSSAFHMGQDNISTHSDSVLQPPRHCCSPWNTYSIFKA